MEQVLEVRSIDSISMNLVKRVEGRKVYETCYMEVLLLHRAVAYVIDFV